MLDETPATVCFEYQNADHDIATTRHVLLLLNAPRIMLTGIDLRQNAVRTYNIARITNLRRNLNSPEQPLSAIMQACTLPWLGDGVEGSANNVAANMLKDMLPQLSILVLLAQAARDGLSPTMLDIIDRYIRRDAIFTVKDGWTDRGSKTAVWPRMREQVAHLKPYHSRASAYVRTINEGWTSERRFAHFNDAASDICAQGGTTSAQFALVTELNKGNAR